MIAGCRAAAMTVICIVTGLLLGACGGGGQASGSSTAATPSTAARSQEGHGVPVTHTPHGREEKQAYRVVSGVYRALAAAKHSGPSAARGAGAYCKLLSTQAQARMIRGAQLAGRPGEKWGCVNAVRFMLARSKQDGPVASTKDERVVGVDVVGETATATVKAASGQVSHLPLVKEGRRWKVAASG